MRQDKAQSVYSPLRITNSEDQLLADKFQFFSDSLRLICHKSGEYLPYEVENHISLLKHALFMADCTIERPNKVKYCVKQLKYLFNSNPLFSEKDTILNEDKDRKPQINTWLDKIKNEPLVGDGLNNLRNIRAFIDEIRQIMEPNYLDFVVKTIYTKFGCSHTVKHHTRDLESLARIIFSWHYLQGRSREVISQFVKNSLSGEIRVQENYMYPTSYLPKDLYQKLITHNRSGNEFDQALYDEIAKYLEDRGSEGQVKSLEYISHYEKHKNRLFFLLEGLTISSIDDDDAELDTLGLKIISISYFKKKYVDYDYQLFSSGFLSDEKYSAIVEIEVLAYTMIDAVYIAFEELNNRLGKIMRKTNCRFSINRKHYAVLEEKDSKLFWTNPTPEVANIGDFEVEEVNNYEERIMKSPHRDFQIEFDYILQQGYLEDNTTTSIHYCRKYMDILFNKIDDCGIQKDETNGIPPEILCLAYLLLFTDSRKFQFDIRLWAHNRITNSVFYPTFNNPLVHSYREKVRETRMLPSLKTMLKHIIPEQEHTRFETSRAMNYPKRIDKKTVFNFYIRQLLYIKQYRDKHEHANITDDTVARKLNLYSYRILSQLQKDIFNELSKRANKGKTHGEVLKNMILTAKESLLPRR